MTEFIFKFHHGLWGAIIGYCLIVSIGSFYNWIRKSPYKKLSEIKSRVNIGLVHTQMLLGIILMTHSTKLSYSSFSFTNTITNYWSYFHPILMFAAIICVTLSIVLVRNMKEDQQKHLFTWVLNILAFLFIGFALYLMPKV
jgi:vacuolar-type H+-ATPase subunit I/STV1